MKVAIASLGRFHVLDLARELDALGIDTKFYSYVPRKRAIHFRLPVRCHKGLLPLVAPLVGAQMFAGSVAPGLQERLMARSLNIALSLRLEQCEKLICMSGTYYEAAVRAKRDFGCEIWLERGSRHITSQLRIMSSSRAARQPSAFIVDRELRGYDLADRIVVSSMQVWESFMQEDRSLANKLFVNPYGVDLDEFPLRVSGTVGARPKTVLFIGAWSWRKGVDLLRDAIRMCDNVRLLHVGSIVDVPFPFGDAAFVHFDPVPQWKLKEFYSQADVFALASREEGLALVQAQALSSGLPLVCTTATGGTDLAHTPILSKRIFVTPPEDARGLASSIFAAIEFAATSDAELSEDDRAPLSWRAYGERYAAELIKSDLSITSECGA